MLADREYDEAKRDSEDRRRKFVESPHGLLSVFLNSYAAATGSRHADEKMKAAESIK